MVYFSDLAYTGLDWTLTPAPSTPKLKMNMRKSWIRVGLVYVCHRVRSCDFDVTFLELGIIIDNVIM